VRSRRGTIRRESAFALSDMFCSVGFCLGPIQGTALYGLFGFLGETVFLTGILLVVTILMGRNLALHFLGVVDFTPQEE